MFPNVSRYRQGIFCEQVANKTAGSLGILATKIEMKRNPSLSILVPNTMYNNQYFEFNGKVKDLHLTRKQ